MQKEWFDGQQLFGFYRLSSPSQQPLPRWAKGTGADPLPSWNDGSSRPPSSDFVTRITREGGPDFVAPADRIATFDNDGTLWTEQPMYIELAFTIDRVKELAPQHPDWQTRQPFAAVLHNDMKAWRQAAKKESSSFSSPPTVE